MNPDDTSIGRDLKTPIYSSRVLAFIDIVGWSDLVSRLMEKPSVIRRIHRALWNIEICAVDFGPTILASTRIRAEALWSANCTTMLTGSSAPR